MNKVKSLAMFFLPISLLFGCAANQENEAMDNRDNNEVRNVQYRNDVDTQDDGNVNNLFDRNNDNDGTRMEVADEAADRISELNEVKSANVIVTNQNAYVAVVLNDNTQGEVTDKLENKIADKVRDTDKNIEQVFVSSNPDFVDRIKDYGNRINQGHPIEGLFDEFNEMVRRVFPNAR